MPIPACRLLDAPATRHSISRLWGGWLSLSSTLSASCSWSGVPLSTSWLPMALTPSSGYSSLRVCTIPSASNTGMTFTSARRGKAQSTQHPSTQHQALILVSLLPSLLTSLLPSLMASLSSLLAIMGHGAPIAMARGKTAGPMTES
ncbi:hypothetical protein D3C72_1857510 [compost metagenome]